MTESKPQKDKRKSLKAYPPTWKKLTLIQRSMADPETLEEPSKERVVELAIEALERERLTKSAPILENSDYNSLTDDKNSVIISVRPEEKEPVERLVAILRVGGDFAARLQQELSLLFRKIGGGADVGEVRSEGKAADGRLGSATPVRRMVAKSLREGTHKDAKNEHPI